MHLPDPNYVSFVTAVITSVTAAIGLGKLILEKKSASGTANVPQKKLHPIHYLEGLPF